MSSEGTTNDPSLPPTWEALVRRIAREVAVEVVESAEVRLDSQWTTPYGLRVPRGEETSAANVAAVPDQVRPPACGGIPASGETATTRLRAGPDAEEAGPPSGGDETTAKHLYCGRCGFELTERIRAYGDARVREAIEGVAYVYEGWSGPAKEVLEYMRAELDLQKACRK